MSLGPYIYTSTSFPSILTAGIIDTGRYRVVFTIAVDVHLGMSFE